MKTLQARIGVNMSLAGIMKRRHLKWVIFYSGKGRRMLEELELDECTMFIQKPIKNRILLQHLRTLLDNNRKKELAPV